MAVAMSLSHALSVAVAMDMALVMDLDLALTTEGTMGDSQCSTYISRIASSVLNLTL